MAVYVQTMEDGLQTHPSTNEFQVDTFGNLVVIGWDGFAMRGNLAIYAQGAWEKAWSDEATR